MLAAVLALVAAVVFDRYGLGPKWIGDRFAAVLALFGFSYFVANTPVSKWLLSTADTIATAVANFVRQFTGPNLAEAIGRYGIAVIVTLVVFFWIMALVPNKTSKYLGDAATREMSSVIIWGGALVIVIGSGLIPGDLGELFRAITRLGVGAGGTLAGVMT